MHTAIHHNNRAIHLLEKGYNEQALMAFKKAAQMMYSSTQELKQRRARGSALERTNVSTVYAASEKIIATDNSFIRSTPLLMSYSEEPTSSCTLESATILVNMALCYHLDSLRPNAMPGGIYNAVTLYEMAYSLGLQVHEDSRSHPIVLMALNNMGQLYHEIGNFDKSRLYFEDLSAYVVMLGEIGEGHNVSDRHDFMLNAMVLRNPNTCAGAA